MRFHLYGNIKESKKAQPIIGVNIKLYLNQEKFHEGKSFGNGFYELKVDIDDSCIENDQQLLVIFEKEDYKKQEHYFIASERAFNMDVALEEASPSPQKAVNWLSVIIGGVSLIFLLVGILVVWHIFSQPKLPVNITTNPEFPNIKQKVTFIATASNVRNIKNMEIYVNDTKVKEGSVSPCAYEGGPFLAGNVSYWAIAYDKAGKKVWTGKKTFKVCDPIINNHFLVKSIKPGCPDNWEKINEDYPIPGYLSLYKEKLGVIDLTYDANNRIGLKQVSKTNFTVDSTTEFTITFIIEEASLEGDGWDGTESPVSFVLKFSKKDSPDKSFCRLYNYTHDKDSENNPDFEKIKKNEWITKLYNNADMEVPEGYILKEIELASSGSKRKAYIDKVYLSNDGLICYYPFNDDYNDYGPNGLDGNPCGDVKLKEGIIGKAAEFECNGDYIMVKDNDFLKTANVKTITAWVNKSGVFNSDYGIVSKYKSDTTSESGFLLKLASSKNEYSQYEQGLSSMYKGISETRINRSNISLKKWYFLVTTTEINKESVLQKLYINGVLVALKRPYIRDLQVKQNPNNLLIGGWYNDKGAVSQSSFFCGLIDEVRLYNRVLSDSEIQQLYYEQFNINDSIDL